MSRSRSSWTEIPPSLTCVCSPSAALPRAPALGMAPKHRGVKFPVAKLLTLLAACLGAAFAASTVLEAFDNDLDLWPFGAEDLTTAQHVDLAIGDHPFSTLFALSALRSL